MNSRYKIQNTFYSKNLFNLSLTTDKNDYQKVWLTRFKTASIYVMSVYTTFLITPNCF